MHVTLFFDTQSQKREKKKDKWESVRKRLWKEEITTIFYTCAHTQRRKTQPNTNKKCIN